jgi:iron complex outermembrane receptor protein
VLREPLQRRLNDLRLTAGYENGHGQPQMSWTRNDVLGERSTYNLSLSALRTTRLDDVAMRTREVDAFTGATLLDQEETAPRSIARARDAHLALQWRHGPGESFTLTPFLVASEGKDRVAAQTVQTAGATPLPYVSAFTAADSDYSMFRLNAQEQRRVGPDSRIELRGTLSTASWRSRSVRQEFDAAQALTRTLEESTDNTDRTWRIAAKLTDASRCRGTTSSPGSRWKQRRGSRNAARCRTARRCWRTWAMNSARARGLPPPTSRTNGR